MEDSNNNERQTDRNKHTISRREFLKRTGLGGLALLLHGCIPPTLREIAAPVTPAEATRALIQPIEATTEEFGPQEKLRRFDMEDFWDFYKTIENFKNKYLSAGDGVYFGSIFDLCSKIVNDKTKNIGPELQRIRDDWGTEKEKSTDAALEHISTISVFPVDGASDNSDDVKKNQLTKFARALAPMALALPKELYLFKFGFAQTTKDYIATKSFADFDANTSWMDFYHECTHAADLYPDRYKNYISRKDYLAYAAKYFELSDNLLSQSAELSTFDEFKQFWNGSKLGIDMGLPDIRAERIPVIEELENQLLGKKFGDKALGIRYERLLWTTLRELDRIRNNRATNERLTDNQMTILNSEAVSKMMSWTAYDVLHTLVDTNHEFLEDSQAAEISPQLNEVIKEMNSLRVRTFATFEVDEEKDPMPQLKHELGIS